jgi:hypothetical protein
VGRNSEKAIYVYTDGAGCAGPKQQCAEKVRLLTLAELKQTGHRSVQMVRRYIRDGSLFRETARANWVFRGVRPQLRSHLCVNCFRKGLDLFEKETPFSWR